MDLLCTFCKTHVRDITGGKHNSRVEWQKSWVVGCYITSSSSSSFPLGPGVGVAAPSQQFFHCTNLNCALLPWRMLEMKRGAEFIVYRAFGRSAFFSRVELQTWRESGESLTLGADCSRDWNPHVTWPSGEETGIFLFLSRSPKQTYVLFFLGGKVLLLHGFRRRSKAALLQMKWKYTPA